MKKMTSIDHAIATGKYATVVSTSVTKLGSAEKPKALADRIREAGNDLKKVNPAYSNAVPIAQLRGEIVVKLVVLASNQGAIFQQTTDSPSIEEQAMEYAKEGAQFAAEKSKDATEYGNALASKGEQQWPSLDQLKGSLEQSPDETVTRKVIDRSRANERVINYPQGTSTLGGNRKIPAHVISEATFLLTRCHILGELNRTSLEMQCEGDIPCEIAATYQMKSDKFPVLVVDDHWVSRLLRYALASGAKFDLEVRVAEKVGTGKRELKPVRIRNAETLIQHLHENLDGLLDEIG